jgi:hypothetical protein
VSASVLLVVLGAYPAAAGDALPTGDPAPQGMAVSEWYRLSQVNANVTEERLWSLRRDAFSVVYADVGEYLEAVRAPGLEPRLHGPCRGRRANWTAEDHRYLGPLVLQLIADYNSDADPDERLRGVQFDIEPYVEDRFWDNVKRSLQDYLLTLMDIVDAYEQVRTRYGNEGLALGFAIPFWFDGTPEAPAVQFGENPEPKAATFHLIDMLRDLPDAYILVMAYRNKASGDDGSIALVEREFDYASRIAHSASEIVVGQEFTEVTPTKLSFWWNGPAAFRQAVAELTDAYGKLPRFRGVAVDDADAYQEVGEYGPPW